MGCNCCDAPMAVNFGEIIKVQSEQTVIDGGTGISVVEIPDEHGGTILEITAVDLSHDTVTPSSLLEGYTAHNAAGEPIVGTATGGRRPGCLNIDVRFGETIRVPVTDYLKLINKPSINGVELIGDLSLEDLHITRIYYDTTENWISQSDLVTEQGAIYIYSDAYTGTDPYGNPYNIASIKIGDGETHLSDMPFVAGSGADSDAFEEHISNQEIHVGEDDRSYWDNKVSMYVNPDNSEDLIFTVGHIPDSASPAEDSDERPPYSGEFVQIIPLTDDPDSPYNISWKDAKNSLSNGDRLFLVISNNIYEATSAVFDFTIRKYVLKLSNVTNEFDRIVIFAENQTGNLHP